MPAFEIKIEPIVFLGFFICIVVIFVGLIYRNRLKKGQIRFSSNEIAADISTESPSLADVDVNVVESQMTDSQIKTEGNSRVNVKKSRMDKSRITVDNKNK